MATINADQLVELFKKALNEKWGYIWGQAGAVWTQAKQNAATRENTVKYGQKWVGRRVSDCSGLFSWAFKTLGGYMYHGSNTIWNKYCTNKGTLTPGQTLKPGTAMFLVKNGNRHHIGLYVGGDTVIEAKGTIYGVVTSRVSHWDEWGELKGVDYSNTQPVEIKELELGGRILKKTYPYMDGNDVKQLQTKLNELGYSCGNADGVFGTKTEVALKKFQQDKGLTVDGIFGSECLAALNGVASSKQPSSTEKDTTTPEKVPTTPENTDSTQTYTTVSGDTLWKIAKKFLGAGSRYKDIMTANNLKNTIVRPGMVLTIPKA